MILDLVETHIIMECRSLRRDKMDLTALFDIMNSKWIFMLLLPLLGYICWKNPYEYNTFAECVAAIGGNEGTILISSEQAVTANLTIPTNITLRFIQGGSLTISVGKTVAINGHVEAGLYQIFKGTGSVTFGVGSVEFIFPEWWGIDGVTDETEIGKAITAAATVLNVKLQPGKTYTLTSAGIALAVDNLALICEGGVAILQTSADIDALTLSKERIIVKNVYTANSGTSTKAGIKLDAGAKSCYLENPRSGGFEYNMELVSSGAGAGVYYNTIFNLKTSSAEKYDVYIHDNGGHVNENLFIGGDFHGTETSEHVYMEGNQNKFIGVSMEGWKQYGFAIIDMGMNLAEGCRFEYNAARKPAYGVYAENASANFVAAARYANNYWMCSRPYIALYAGRIQMQDASFVGGMLVSGDRVATTVDANSNAGQKVLNVASTTGMNVDDTILIDDEEDGDGKEWNTIDVVTPGVSITLVNDLRYTHTAVSADTVVIKERKCGMELYGPGANLDFYVWGIKQSLEGSLVWDPANLVDGAGVDSGNITVVDAALGDKVDVYPPYDTQGIIPTGRVTAADTVRIWLQNETGGAIDLGNDTWKVKVYKY